MDETLPSMNFSDGTMVGDANEGGNGVILNRAYGWIFSTVTAFGLLVFLSFSFACYHRRLATRKAREDEYAEFLRIYRPDLDSKGLKRPRATINAFSAKLLASRASHHPSNAYINEGFEFGIPNERTNTMAADYNDRTDEDIDYMINTEYQLQKKYTQTNSNHYGNLPEIRGFSKNRTRPNSITTASVHTNAPDSDTGRESKELAGNSERQLNNESEENDSVFDKHLNNDYDSTAFRINASDTNTEDLAQIKHKPPLASRAPPLPFKAESLGDVQSKRKKLKKKRQTYEQSATRKAALSFDDDVPYLFNHYTVPRRQSEPGRFMYDHSDGADVGDVREERVQYNPYYVEMGTRLEQAPRSHLHKQRRNTQAHVEPVEYHTYGHHDVTNDVTTTVQPDMTDVYQGDIENNTWM